MEKPTTKRGYVESIVGKNHTIASFTEATLLQQEVKKMRRKRKHRPSQKGSKQKVMRHLIQQECMLKTTKSGR